MRKPRYLSPSSIKTFNTNRDEFYLKYLAENRPEKFPQTQPMSVGSAFDAYVKSYLYEKLVGPGNPEYERDTIFEKQVEKHNRDWARKAGQHVFERYCECGALADLILELQKSVGPPRFEFEITGTINGNIASVPMTGKPDVFFVNEQAARIIYDWKVNGYCANSPVSPKPGFVICRDTWRSLEKKPTRGNALPHKDCQPDVYKGVRINRAAFMENVDIDWANQLSVYSWLLGEPIGSLDLVIGIDQICCQPGPSQPWLRVASHRLRVGSEYQFQLHERVQYIWNVIESGHIFDDLPRELSDEKCADLDNYAKLLKGDDDLSKFMAQMRMGSQ